MGLNYQDPKACYGGTSYTQNNVASMTNIKFVPSYTKNAKGNDRHVVIALSIDVLCLLPQLMSSNNMAIAHMSMPK